MRVRDRRRRIRATLRTAPLLAAGGCLSIEGRVPRGFDPPPAAAAQPSPAPAGITPSPGAIGTLQRFTGLAEDDRARGIGDVLTIQLAEKTDAQKTATSAATHKAASA